METKPDLRLEIAHVLFIDIVGYSKLLINEQSELLQELNQIVRGTEAFRAAEAAGRFVRIPAGDGMALVFSTTPEAPVQCAMEISKALKARPELRVRMGIHSGPVSGIRDVNDRSNLAGGGINTAQRVMNCGDAGHILLSKRVAEDLAQYRNWQPLLHDLGECKVKHDVTLSVVNLYTDEIGNAVLPQKFARERQAEVAPAPSPIVSPSRRRKLGIAAMALVAMALAAFFWLFLQRSPTRSQSATSGVSVPSPIAALTAAVPEKSIAVLPFQNLSDDKSNAYFANGIQDEILTRLSKIADLKVISRTSTQRYKSAPENLPGIGKQLGVANILEGSVQKSGDVVRINVQLIKAASDDHLWAETFDRKVTDIFSVESEVAKAIADQLRAQLNGREEQAIADKPTDSPEAYDAYLRGLAYTLKTGNTPANALAAQKYLREAVRLDPKFALGWAQLSRIDTRLAQTISQREEARQEAETALRLQPNLGEALLAKGYYHYVCLKDYETAVRYFEQARPVLPNDSQVPVSLAFVARRRGEWDRSENYFNEAEKLDPRNVYLLTQRALSYMHLRRFPEALRKLDQVLDVTPDDPDTLAQKAAIAQAEGDLPRAAAFLAPLHPIAADSDALETQIYQAILERRPAQLIARLREMLAKPDPALGALNGELRFWLGWAQQIAGDRAGAQESWRQAQIELEPFLREQPEDYGLLQDLALVNMGLGDKAVAFGLTERAIAAIPLDKDALDGPGPIDVLARVAAQMGEPERAIAALEKVLSIPYNGALASGVPLTPALLRLDPMFDPLRKDPRFEKLAASPPLNGVGN